MRESFARSFVWVSGVIPANWCCVERSRDHHRERVHPWPGLIYSSRFTLSASARNNAARPERLLRSPPERVVSQLEGDSAVSGSFETIVPSSARSSFRYEYIPTSPCSRHIFQMCFGMTIHAPTELRETSESRDSFHLGDWRNSLILGNDGKWKSKRENSSDLLGSQLKETSARCSRVERLRGLLRFSLYSLPFLSSVSRRLVINTFAEHKSFDDSTKLIFFSRAISQLPLIPSRPPYHSQRSSSLPASRLSRQLFKSRSRERAAINQRKGKYRYRALARNDTLEKVDTSFARRFTAESRRRESARIALTAFV